MTSGFQVLIVDDEPNVLSGLEKGLAAEAEKIDVAADVDDALAKFQQSNYQIVVSDVHLSNGQDGLSLLSQILKRKPDTTAIVVTAGETVDKAVEAMRRGAFDYITKPVDCELIQQQVRRALEHQRLLAENRTLKDRLADAGEICEIIGNCVAMQGVICQVRQVARTNAAVLIHGESGTGKELIARVLHDLSGRRTGPFVSVNLGALPESLLEAELVGCEPSRVNGSSQTKIGCFEQAAGGTLFLDAVGDVAANGQQTLLRVLETGQFCRLGSEVPRTADVRIVSATNRDLHSLVEAEKFRDDLLYRLNVVPVYIPPLRERRSDIPLLCEHFLRHFCARYNRAPKRLADESMRVLMAANWPGNVRQLRNLMERLVVTVNDDVIGAGDLPHDIAKDGRPICSALTSLAAATELAEKEAIQIALIARNFHREQTAKALGISLRTLHYKMNRYGIH